MIKTLVILGISAMGTVIASNIASRCVKDDRRAISFTPEQWDYYHRTWPSAATAN